MKTYYIQISDCQNNTIAVVAVEAENKQEAQNKALRAIHVNDDISTITKSDVEEMLDNGEIEYVIDEDGCEVDIDD